MTNPIAKARNQKVFVVKETTIGTLAYPADANMVVAAGYCSMNQQPSFSDSNEIKNSRDILERFQDQFPPGTWALPMYLRPSGAAGTAPDGDVLFECLMGTKTVTGGVSVAYTQDMEKASFSLWCKKDHTVFWARGCTVNQLDLELGITGGAKSDFSGEFMEMGWAGTDLINGALSTSDTAVVVDDAKKFTVGSKIELVESDVVKNNSGSGYEITAINVSTNTLTISPGAEEAINDNSTIRGYLPDGTETGAPLESRKGYLQLDSVTTPIQTYQLTVNDPAQMLQDEIRATDYPEEYAEGTRNIEGSIGVYFRQDDVPYFYDGQNSNEKDIDMIIGDTAGSIVTVSAPQSELEVPGISEADPTVALNMNVKAKGSTGEDSLSITFT